MNSEELASRSLESLQNTPVKISCKIKTTTAMTTSTREILEAAVDREDAVDHKGVDIRIVRNPLKHTCTEIEQHTAPYCHDAIKESSEEATVELE